MPTENQVRPLVPTAAASDMLKFLGVPDSIILESIGQSGLLTDPSTFAARRLPFGSIQFVAFRNGAPEIRLFLSLECLNDREFLHAEPLSWSNA